MISKCTRRKCRCDAWPEGKYTELATRLVLNCQGSAFMKLQLHQKEIMGNDKQSIKKIIEILGGHWGQISLERRYEFAERALYKCVQKADETADSYLARADIMWTELNSRSMKLADLQAYVTLRGSNLSSDDKKKVLVDSDAAGTGDLSVQKVSSAIRLLGAGFFHDVTGVKRTKLKTYDQATLAMDEVDNGEGDEIFAAESEMFNEDEMIEGLLAEGDDDAVFITDFENAASEVIQGDEELAAAFTSYTDARKRLNEKMRFRGFWPVSASGKSKGFQKGKVKGKFSKGHNSSRKSLEQRILSSRCRICNKVGHWKAECPDRQSRGAGSQSNAVAPTSFVSAETALPLEFLAIPAHDNDTLDEPQQSISLVSYHGDLDFRGKLRVSLKKVQGRNPKITNRSSAVTRMDENQRDAHEPVAEEPALFATHGSLGVVDLGATKTVIGSDLVADLINNLHPNIRKKLSRCPCNVTFRFGNHGTLKSEQALVVPLPNLLLKVAIVPGGTPFLISNTLLRAFQAVIDVQKHVMWSKKFNREYPLQLTPKGLFLVDLNDLAETSANAAADRTPAETHLAEEAVPKEDSHQRSEVHPHEKMFSDPPSQTTEITSNNTPKQANYHTHEHASHEGQKVKQSGELAETKGPETPVRPLAVATQDPSARSSKTYPPCSQHAVDAAVIDRPPAEDPSHSPGKSARPSEALPRGDGQHEGGFRDQTPWSPIPGCLERRSKLDHVVSKALLPECQNRTSSHGVLHRVQDRTCRARRKTGLDDHSNIVKSDAKLRGSWEVIAPQSQSQASTGVMPRDSDRASRASGLGNGRCRTVREHGSPDRTQSDGSPSEHHGECHQFHPPAPRADGPSTSTPECLEQRIPVDAAAADMFGFLAAGDPSHDCDQHENLSSHSCAERQRFWKLVHKYEKELMSMAAETKTSTISQKRLDVLEVFCGPNSQLTKQCNNLGYNAERLGYAQCDLQNSEGRTMLFKSLLQKRPENVWFSPACGPWSGWSTLNGSRSVEAWDELQESRMKHLEQIALGVVLLRYQRSQGRHFHWEQSQASLMFKLPYLNEVHHYTKAVDFDMCQAGNLQDPESGKFIKKGMTILSTSQRVLNSLKNKKCHGNHDHQVIEGSVKVGLNRMNRSTFSEAYPRKFARDLAKVPCKAVFPRERPILFIQDHEGFPTFVNEPAMKRRRLIVQARPKVARSSEMTPDMLVKRQKLIGKQTQETALEAWTKVFNQVDNSIPRVGKREIRDVTLLQELQGLLPDKQIQFAIACRGSSRTIAPPTTTVTGEAPYRKCAYLQRGTTRIFVEDQWENWEELSKRQRTRPSHQCRINITVFACNPCEASNERESRNSGQVILDDPPSQASDAIPLTPTCEDSTRQQGGVIKTNQHVSPGEAVTASEPLIQETQDQGPQHKHQSNGSITISINEHAAFQRLPKNEQQTISKIHKNLGHPSPERMSTLMLQQGFRAEMIQAARHYQCGTCVQNSQPKHARPSSFKDDLDFNDRISMDGVKWTSPSGQSYHFYHVIDWATNFQMANVAPSRTTDDAINAFMNMWVSWAGVPGELLIDAASELNSDGFATFLQEHNIKATTISPEAHFQNGKAERHGAILQNMLNKFHTEHPITTYAQFQQAVWWCVQSKNACSLKKGFAPEVLVLGKHTRLPGAVSSDMLLPSHLLADAETAQGIQFRKQLALRESARRAFHSADNDAALRRALLRRSNPHRGNYQPGEWVMSWLEGTGQTPGFWQGPMKVVVHENQHTIWTTMSSKLFRCAPEHVRPVTAEEAQDIVVRSDEPTSSEIARQIPPHPEGGVTRVIQGDSGIMPHVSPTPVAEMPSSGSAGNNTNSGSSNQEEQPDHEPDVPSPPTEEAESREHIDTPVPDESDDDLICEGLICQDAEVNALDEIVGQFAWKSEIVISEQDIHRWQEEPDAEEMTFLATAAKKQRSEVRLTELTATEREEFAKAKDTEITNWLKTGTVQKMFRNQLSPEQILRCRWILTWKPIENSEVDPKNPQKTQRAKARIVVLGYMDPKITEIPRDSPTLNKLSKMLILQLIASRSWDLRSFDIKAAFLQGRPQSDRVIGIEPVPELAKRMQLLPSEICRLTKSAYGLIDAPFLWYQALKDELMQLGFETSPFCPCTFVLRDPQTKEPDGVIGIHVDDGLCGGNQRFVEKLQALERKYPFGSHKTGQFTFTGIDMFQHPNKGITMSQAEYVKKISPIKISSERRQQESSEVTPEERLALRGLIGSLQYAAVHTRPDLSSRLSFLQSDINKATIQTLLEANKTLHEAKRHSHVTVTIQPINCSELRFLAFSDASFASKKIPDSHTGCIIMSTHKNIEKNTTCLVNPISWGCKKIQRVVTSTLAAETVSLSSVLDQLSWIRLCWAWLLNPKVRWQEPEQALIDLPQSFSTATYKAQNLPEGLAATDCKSLFDLVTRTATPTCSEYRTMLNAKKIKEMLEEGVQLRWVASGAQLADSLTKIMDTSFLRETLLQGQYRLNDELEILKQRANARNRLKGLRSNCQEVANNESCLLSEDIDFYECELHDCCMMIPW